MLDDKGVHIPGTLPENAPPPASNPTWPTSRSAAEVGSPEFAEDRTQINSLNNKLIFRDEMGERNANEGIRSQLASRMIQSLDQVLNVAQKLDAQFLQGLTDRARFVEGWEYNRAYDLANPVAVATGSNITAGGVPANRITDTSGAIAGAGVNASVATSALNNATIQLATLTTMVDELAQSQNTANTTIAGLFANVLSVLGKIQQAMTPANPTAPTAGAA